MEEEKTQLSERLPLSKQRLSPLLSLPLRPQEAKSQCIPMGSWEMDIEHITQSQIVSGR